MDTITVGTELNTTELFGLAGEVLMPNYGERRIALARGKGTRVWDTDGREYLDFLCGISVTNLGHCHPTITAAIREQADAMLHCSNLYLIPQQVELARRLVEKSFADRAFFCNTGAEANEGAVKLARLYSSTKHGGGRHRVITFSSSFHGRTLAMISATAQTKVQKGFEPLVEGFRYAQFNDLQSVHGQLDESVCAIMVEPVQGEGGCMAASPEFLRGLRALCDERDILLILDEVQCGMARTGKMFAYEHYGIEPDIMSLAKALGNGYPIAAVLAGPKCATTFTPGSHGTTLGGNPLACAVGLAVLDTMDRYDIVERAAQMGGYFRRRMRDWFGALPNVQGYRGLGLMVGVELAHKGADVVKKCADNGLLLNCTAETVLRILPPLTVSEEEIDEAVEILHGVLAEEAKIHAAPAGAQGRQ